MFVVDLLTRIEDAYPVGPGGEAGSGSGSEAGAEAEAGSNAADPAAAGADHDSEPGGLRRRGTLQLKTREAAEHLVVKRREEDEEQLWHQAHEMKPLRREEARSQEMMWFAFGSQLAFVVVCIVLKWLDI